MLNIMFVMAELQLDQLKSGWKTAKGRAIGRGAHIGIEGSVTLVPDPVTGPCGHEAVSRRGIGRRDLGARPVHGRDLAATRWWVMDHVLDRSRTACI
jgi:hypothetical protein